MKRVPTNHPLPEPLWPSAEEAARARLFRPITLRSGLSVRTRTWVPAMVPWRATEEGEVTPALIDWYARYAEGWPGVLVVEATGIRDVPSGPLLRIGHDRYLPGLRRLVDAVREASGGRTRLFIQLIDFLAIRRRPEPEKYLRRFLKLRPEHGAALAALLGDPGLERADEATIRERLVGLDPADLSRILDVREMEALTHGHRERVTDVHLPHVASLPQTLPGLFADAAGRAREAGFDGVELHYAHAYTMSSFLSRLNTRSDGYGRTLAGRARLPLEVYRAVRRRVGPRYTVGCRFLGDDVVAGGSRIEDARSFARAFAEAGMDFLSVSKGGRFEDAKQPRVGEAAYPYTGPSGHECMPTVRLDARGPFSRNVVLSREIREAVRGGGFQTPVVAAGGIAGFGQAEGILRRSEAEFVAAARQSMADPDWWRLMETGQGEAVRRCIFTNYCEGLDQKHKEVTCQLWDKEDVSGAGELVSTDGRRRLTPPRRTWSGMHDEGARQEN